ncbi:MAG: D-xylose ABC transporter substrate-binding protein, partial [Rhodospirillaceae bacterium]|nr:D-xylose ABC transporter substrate-binding protein [Rhodospirillaceae bacterium]
MNRIALGTQTVSVWKDSRELGKAAATIALDLAKGAKLADVPGTIKWKSPKGVEMNATFLKPVAITKDNLDVVINAGWI